MTAPQTTPPDRGEEIENFLTCPTCGFATDEGEDFARHECQVRHGIGTITSDFLGGRYVAVCECSWASEPKANHSLAEFALSKHREEVGWNG
jgi:hypothetical protein